MVQLEYFFRASALAARIPLPSLVISLLSYKKNTGLIGELRLRSSSEADAILSSRTGSGGRTVGSGTGSGAAGGGAAAAAAPGPVGGGGAARATGGVFLPHAATPAARTTRTT